MRFAHRMPFGAEVVGDGVRFRLWAPARAAVNLVLNEDEIVAMHACESGWHELICEAARPGTRYRFELDDRVRIADPASRFQPEGIHGPSLVVDPRAYEWRIDWRGRAWEEAVLYELHLGAFSQAGTFDGARAKLDHLVDLGVTALELMPVAAFAGARNWGYDGALLFAPDRSYGAPHELKALVDAAHERGLMVLLDVVYNHFGPEGNYLHLVAPDFFTKRRQTPWGAAIDFSVRTVRDFFIHNALYWLEEYRVDGLRLDAVHAIFDDGDPDILVEVAETVRAAMPERHVHLVLENDRNAARYLERDAGGAPKLYTAQWNDDLHHAAHVVLTGESGGYYRDYVDRPVDRLARALAEGFVYQGEPSRFRGGAPRGEPSAHLPPAAFVSFLQNHDQVGNRAFGERLGALARPQALRAMLSVLLLAPQIPLLFMGEEWGAPAPFRYFCDFEGALAKAVREGRRREFTRFPGFADPASRRAIPDPNALAIFADSRLDWSALESDSGRQWFDTYRSLLRLRRDLVPRLAAVESGKASAERWGETGLTVVWPLAEGRLCLMANLGDAAADGPRPPAEPVFVSHPEPGDSIGRGRWPAWSCAWLVEAIP